MNGGALRITGRASFFRATGNKCAFMLDSGVVSSVSQHSPTQSPDRSHIILDDPPSPKQKWVLTAESFDRLLLWLNPDRNEAGKKYEEIRLALIKRFQQLHSRSEPETLANITFDRVARKLPKIAATYVGPPEPYFFSVAHFVYKEDLRKPIQMSLPAIDLPASSLPAEEALEKELLYSCLQHCIEELSPANRVLIRDYYYGEGQEKIRRRKEIALKMDITLALLRLKAQRIRTALKKCILECMEGKGLERETIM